MVHVIPSFFISFRRFIPKSKILFLKLFYIFERQHEKLSLKPTELLEVFTYVSLTEFKVMC